MRNFLLFIFILLSFYGCNENSHNEIVSLGKEMSAEEIEKINNLDRASYAELENIVKDNRVIDAEGKYLMIIFGANGCIYCDELKKTIKNSSAIQAKLKEYFSPYYINFSYMKPHKFITEITDKPIITSDLVRIYHVSVTPTTVFATPEGKTIISYPGAIPEKQFLIMLDFISNEQWKKANDNKEIADLLNKTLRENQ